MPDPASINPTANPACANKAADPHCSLPEAVADQTLVNRFREGDEAAFAEIMERYRQRIFNVALGLLHNHADAEEITQDAFIAAHRALAGFRGNSALSTWLHRIAVNLSLNRHWYFHRRHRRDTLSLDCALGADSVATLSDLLADAGPDPAEETLTHEFSVLVDRCREQLHAQHREILTLRDVHNRSYEEIAETLGTNLGTVKSRIARARENLRTGLNKTCPEFARCTAPGAWFLPPRVKPSCPVMGRN